MFLAASMVAAGLGFAPSAVADAVADEAVVVGLQNNGDNPVTWTGAGGVPPVPAHDPENEACGSGCAESLVRVDVDPTYWTDRAGALKVRLCTPDCSSSADLADFDLYVYEADAQGRRVRLANFSDARPANAPEVVGVGRPAGYYIVRVVTAVLLTATPRYTVELSIGEGVKFAAIAMGLTCPSDPFKAETRLSQDSPTIYFDSCAGFVRRLHEPPLYVNLSVPLGAMQPLPAIVMLHGWTGTGGAWRPATADGCYTPEICSAGIYHYNSPWFVTRGYAAISYSARGHGSSCGLDQDPPAPAHACTRGWTHAAERSAEVADTQHLLSLAVDAGIAHPDRLGATGGSYGAGQSWLLATAMPWDTPRGTKLQLAAAAPTHGWTSLQNSLVPNGRATDSATQTPDALDAPYGVVKRQLVKELLVDSRKQARVQQCRPEAVELCPSGFVRFNDTDPVERHSHLASWQAFWEAGEPYEPIGRSFSSEFRGKSAYHAEDYLAGVADRSIATVPIFAVSGWADPLFPAVETLQMYRRLKQAHPGYPIWMIVDDTGHTRPDDPTRQEQVRSANDRRTAFFDRYLKGEAVDVGPKVVSRPVSCQDAPAATGAVSAPSWDLARDAAVTLQGGAIPTQRTAHAGRSAEVEGAGAQMDLPCTESSGATLGAALWSWKAPAGGATVLGLPRVSVDYQLTGTDSTVVAKLWDVAPGVDRVRTLLTHGVYRLTAPSSTSSGRLSFQLFGSHWRIGDGHEVELELMQSDAPMFQTDKLASSLVLSSPAVILPTAKGS